MKGLGKLLVIIGILLAIASVAARFVLGSPIDLVLIQVQAASLLVVTNTILLIGIALILLGE